MKVCDRLISLNQTTFIKGRFILESVVTAHEIIHEVAKNKEECMMLKLDYEKACDKVDWDFLENMVRSRDFDSRRIMWANPPCERWFSLCEN